MRSLHAVSQRRGDYGKVRVDSRPCPDPWRSSAPVNSFPRWPSSTPACWPRRAAPGHASRSCRRPRIPTARRSSRAGRRWAWRISASSAPRSSPCWSAIGPRADDPAAAQAIGEADLVYLSGGKPAYLMRVLDGSAVGRALAEAHHRGAVLAGCSAGAMVLAGHAFDFRVRLAPWPLRWRSGLGFVPGGFGHPALRRLARAAVCADRAPGATRLGRCSGSTRRPRSSVATARGRSTVGRGSRSGGVGAATAIGPARRSGSDGASRRRGQSGRTVRKQSEQ